ncbi:MAG: phosphoribosyltransferase [Anaerolineales bacterium]|jgi:hypoxanthine phosphoribosyltransferase
MTQPPYDYSARSGVLPIDWNDFHGLCRALAQAAAGYAPHILLPVGRGGYYPGTLLAHMLQAEVFPVRLSRRVNDQVVYQQPQWLLEPPAQVQGRRVLVVDEICSSGETLRLVIEHCLELGAAAVRSAVLYAHSWGVETPDYIGLVSDALILNPWDREILRAGEFILHPEYVEALRLQGLAPDDSLRIPAVPVQLAKGQPPE